MISKSEFVQNFRKISFFCRLKVLPLDFSIEEATLKSPETLKGKLAGPFWLLIFSLHFLYITFRLAQSLVGKEVELHMLFFQLTIWSVSLLAYSWYFTYYELNRNVFIAIFGSLFSSDSPGMAQNEEPELPTRGQFHMWGITIPLYSRQELLALYLPHLTAITELSIVCMFIWERDVCFLLYSALPVSLRSGVSFAILLVEELNYFVFLGVHGTFAWQVQLLFCEKVTQKLRALREFGSREYSAGNAFRDYKKLRRIQLLVILFNELNAYILFFTKFFAIGQSTLSGYFAIAYFSTNPVFGVMYYTMWISMSVTYSLLYEKAFGIPAEAELTKSRIIMQLTRNSKSRVRQKLTKLLLRSVPEIGIRTGHFHNFEREATPVFIDFVIRNVLGLLVMND